MDILAIGGGGFEPTDRYGARPGPLVRHALSLTGAARPKVCGIMTATGDEVARVAMFHQAFVGTEVAASTLSLFPMPSVDDVRGHLLSQDAIYVGGGSTANLLAVWRVHGLDVILREAWEAGVVLFGVSAGSLCWFQGGTTDSFSPELGPLQEGLGFLPGSHSPHYSSEERRRPLYQSLVADGVLPDGWAADDGVGLHFRGTELHEAVASGPDCYGWRVERTADGLRAVETRIVPRVLDRD